MTTRGVPSTVARLPLPSRSGHVNTVSPGRSRFPNRTRRVTSVAGQRRRRQRRPPAATGRHLFRSRRLRGRFGRRPVAPAVLKVGRRPRSAGVLTHCEDPTVRTGAVPRGPFRAFRPPLAWTVSSSPCRFSIATADQKRSPRSTGREGVGCVRERVRAATMRRSRGRVD
jgi:hypothetical protein